MDNTYATIISLLPYSLTELKSGLNPNEYIINKAEGDKFGLTIIPNNVHYLINPDLLSDAKEVRQIKVPVPAIEVAQSIISDYISALLAVDPPEAAPGLIAVRGDYTDRKEVNKTFFAELMQARSCQNRWFQNLVDIADDTWSKTRSPLGISSLERFAGKSLELKRDWINPTADELLTKCPVCQSSVNPGALKCIACNHILNKKAYDEVMAGAK
jgi:hypothetical protein